MACMELEAWSFLPASRRPFPAKRSRPRRFVSRPPNPSQSTPPSFDVRLPHPQATTPFPCQLAATSFTQPQVDDLPHSRWTTLPARRPTSRPTTSPSTPSTRAYIRRTPHALLSHALVACAPHCALVWYGCHEYYCVSYTYSF